MVAEKVCGCREGVWLQRSAVAAEKQRHQEECSGKHTYEKCYELSLCGELLHRTVKVSTSFNRL